MKMILALAGEMTSGKGTIAKYIVEKYSGSSFRFSTLLRDIANRIYLEESRENLQKISTMFRDNFDENILSRAIARDAEKDPREIIVIDGARRLSDISCLRQLENFKLVFIEASLEKCFERIIQRGENTDDARKTFEEFKHDHENEAELKIRELKNHADCVIDNNGSLEDLYEQIDKIIES